MVSTDGGGTISEFPLRCYSGVAQQRYESSATTRCSRGGVQAIQPREPAFGAGDQTSGPANTLFFNESLNGGNDGLFGTLTPIATDINTGNGQ